MGRKRQRNTSPNPAPRGEEACRASASARDEPGCRQFDVCHDPDHPDHVFLYEVYDDRAAFDAHLSTPHFKSFDAATAGMIRSKKVRALTRL